MVVWIAIAVVTAIAVLLVVLEIGNRRRARRLAHLEPVDPAVGRNAMTEADEARSTAEGWSRAAHQGISGAGGAGPGA